jgi:hypothetical protein
MNDANTERHPTGSFSQGRRLWLIGPLYGDPTARGDELAKSFLKSQPNKEFRPAPIGTPECKGFRHSNTPDGRHFKKVIW